MNDQKMAFVMGETMEPLEILKRPYARVLTPDPDGQYTAEIMEFPGCVTYGATAEEALRRLDEVALEWLAASIEQGQSIPEPMSVIDYSGKLVLRMPKGLHQRAALCAEREGVSLNQFIVTNLAETVGERSRTSRVAHRSISAASVSVRSLAPVTTIAVGAVINTNSSLNFSRMNLSSITEATAAFILPSQIGKANARG